MPTITANITLTKTVATLDGDTFEAILNWIKTNVKEKLPQGTDLVVSFTIHS